MRREIPTISVCIPTYNRAGYLAECVAAILRQTFADFEVVISDNASTDGTREFVSTLRDPRVRYVRNPANVGSRQNWNQCLELARGRYVAILHDDDTYEPMFLARTVQTLEAHPRMGMVYTAAYLIDEEGRRTDCLRLYARDQAWAPAVLTRHFLAHNHDIVFSSVVARRNAYQQAGWFDRELYCGDFEMWLKLTFLFGTAYLSTPLVSYRTHQSSTTLTIHPGRFLEENRLIISRFIDWASEREPTFATYRADALAAVDRVWASRLLYTAWALLAEGAFDRANGCLEALRHAQRNWVTTAEMAMTRWCVNPAGRRMARGLRKMRRLVRRIGVAAAN